MIPHSQPPPEVEIELEAETDMIESSIGPSSNSNQDADNTLRDGAFDSICPVPAHESDTTRYMVHLILNKLKC